MASTAGFTGSDFQKNGEASAPLVRIGQPEDAAKLAVFLAGNASAWLTGSGFRPPVTSLNPRVE